MSRPITAILRQKEGGTVGFEKWSYLGQRLVKVADPEGLDIPKGWHNAMILDSELPKIPARVWNAVVGLYIHFMEDPETKDLIKGQTTLDSGLEVAVFFTYNEETKEVEAWVPTQTISGASVEIDYTAPIVNLKTGQVIENGINGLPDCVIKTGTGHSHNTMWAGFSATDDKNELPQPGYHIVVGRFKLKEENGQMLWYHEIAPSIVMGGVRYENVLVPDPENPGSLVAEEMSYEHLIDYDSSADDTWDKGVLNMISMDLASFKRPALRMLRNEFSLEDEDDLPEYYRNQYGLDKYTNVNYDEPDCETPECDGTISTYSGYCWLCDAYYHEHDVRSEGTKLEDKLSEPVYGKEGDLIGCRYPNNGIGQRVYRYTSGKMLYRLQRRHGWPFKDEPYKNASKGLKKKDEKLKGKQDHRSHSSFTDGDVLHLVENAISDNQIALSNESQRKLLRYELKEFAKICLFFASCQDKEAKLQHAMHHIYSNTLGGMIFTQEEVGQLEAMMDECGRDWSDLNEM